MKKQATAIVAVLAYSFAAGGVAASAQDGDYYDANGVNLGGFTLYPSLTARVGHDDNVYAQPANEVSDTYYSLSPSLTLSSNWSRHELSLNLQNTNTWYSENSSEDTSDWTFGADGRIDVSYATSIHARAMYGMLTESRGDSSAVGNAAEPTEYDRFDGYVELRHRFNRLGVAVGGGLTTFDYDDVSAIGGGTIDNDARDRDVLLGQAEVNYAISPDTRVFLRGTYNDRQYDQQPPAVAVNRDSSGYEIAGGLQFDVTRLISGEISGGYLEQEYDALPDVDGLSYGASLNWELTRLTTVTISADRAVEETNQAGASGYLSSTVGAGVVHELTRSISLNANASFSNNDYEGSAREEDVWTAGVGAEYDLNRYLSASVGYGFDTRESSLANADYDRNKIWFGLTGQF